MEAKNQNGKKWYSDLSSSWGSFLSVSLNPLVIIFFLVSLLLLFFSSRQTDPQLTILLTLMLSVITSLLGGIVASKWGDLTQEKVLLTRGKSANRNLQLLLERSISLEKRVLVYLTRFSDNDYRGNITPEVLVTYFEETIQECLSIENFIVNSIQDWTDILPEADIKSVISYIQEQKNKVEEYQNKLEMVTRELSMSIEQNTESSAKAASLLEERNKLITEINQMRENMQISASRTGVANIPSSFLSGGTATTNAMFNHTEIDLRSQYDLNVALQKDTQLGSKINNAMTTFHEIPEEIIRPSSAANKAVEVEKASVKKTRSNG